ncbi:MAG: rod shape-determining protein MreC [Bacteroidales bacterium]|nr:rod shape-determining protein MreC [Bacteroidales bacterium]
MNTLVRFLKRFHFVLLFLLLEGIALTLLVQNNRYQAGQVRRIYNEVTGFIFGEYSSLTDYFNLRRENLVLSAENAQLRSQILQSYQTYDRKLFAVNDTIYKLQYEYTQAKIIRNSTTKRNNYLMINKGANHGVKTGMAVISPNGVVGVVKVVSTNFSSILSLLHSDSRISAKLKRGNFSGSVLWNGKSSGIAQMIVEQQHADVQIGDTIITSGYSLDFPEGIFIGTVSEIRTKPGDNFPVLNVKLSTNFNTLDHVYVVRNLARNELETLLQQHLDDE